MDIMLDPCGRCSNPRRSKLKLEPRLAQVLSLVIFPQKLVVKKASKTPERERESSIVAQISTT